MSQPGERRRRREADRAVSSSTPMVPDAPSKPSRRTRREAPPSAPEASDAPPARYGYRQRSSSADDRRVPSWTQDQPPEAPAERPGRRAETSSMGRQTGPVAPQHSGPVAPRGTGPVSARTTGPVSARTTGPVSPGTTGALPPTAGPQPTPARTTGPLPPPPQTGAVRPAPPSSPPASQSTRGMAPIQDPRPRGTESVWSAGGAQPEARPQVTGPQVTGPLVTGPQGAGSAGTGATQTSAAGWRPSAAGRDAPTTITPLSAPLPSTVPPARPQPRPTVVPPVAADPVVDKPVTGGLPWESIAPDAQDTPEAPETPEKTAKAEKTAKPDKAPGKTVTSASSKQKRGLWSYTLLHVVVLLVVAFVLGVIIWMLLNRDGSALDTMGSPGLQKTTVAGAVAAR